MIVIIIMLVLLILTKKNTNTRNTRNTPKTNIQIVEGFTEPKKYHTPKTLELYQIDKKNKLMNFIFEPPRPLIVANQVKEYILIASSYININNEPYPTHLETITFSKNANLLTSSNEKLLKSGKLMFSIKIPQRKYYDNSGEGDKDKDILYKFGIMAKYPNTYSHIVKVSNLESLSSINKQFNYSEAYKPSHCSSQKGQLTSDATNGGFFPIDSLDENSTIRQLKDVIGGFPDNLNIQDFEYSELKELIDNKESKINFNINFEEKKKDISSDVSAQPHQYPLQSPTPS